MKIGNYLAAIPKKSRRVFTITLLVILGLVLPFSISMFSDNTTMGIAVTPTPALSTPEEQCLKLESKKYEPKTLSFLNRSVYNRTRNPKCFYAALAAAEDAVNNNQAIENKSSKQADELQTQLNNLSLLIDVTEWLNEKKDGLQYDNWMPQQIKINDVVKDSLQKWIGKLKEQIAILPEIQSRLQIDNVPSDAAQIYAQVNFAWNLSRLKELLSNSNSDTLDRIGEFWLTKAIQNAQKLNDKQPEIYALGYYGKWYQMKKNYDEAQKQKNYDEAQKQTEKALRLAESFQAKNVYQWEWQLRQIYNERYQYQYQKYQDEYNNNPNPEVLRKAYDTALTAYENAYKSLQSLRLDLIASEEDDQWAFREKVEEPVYREYIDLILQREEMERLLSPSQTSGNLSQEDLRQVRKVLDSLQIVELESFLQEPCPGYNSELLDQIVEKQDSRAAVIYPIFSDNRISVIIKLSGDKKIYYKINKINQINLINSLKRLKNFNVNTPQIESIFRQLRYSLEQPYFSSEMGIPATQAVYNWLIRPAEKAGIIVPEKTKTLLFVPDGLLRNIPMAALYDSESKKFLIEKYAIGLVPSLQASVAKPNNNYNALIAGLSKDPGLPEFGSLQYAKQEICKVRKIFDKSLAILDGKEVINGKKVADFDDECQPGDKSKPLRKELASSQYNIIHLATHGQFNFFNRKETFVLTSFDKVEKNEDKKIDLNEWEKLVKDKGFNSIELLTLSACETATGDDRDTLGISGVSVRSGARSTLASLWSVNDASTAEFMKEFYTELVKNKLSKAEALQKAQISLLNDGYQPSHWAPYVLVGDWR